MDTLFRRRMMMVGGVSPTPTSGTPYIRGGAEGSYIDTGIKPDETTKIIVWARNFNPGGTSYTWLFGSRVANLDSMFGLTLMSNANLGKIRVSFGAVNNDLSDKWPLMSHYHKYELSVDGFYVDDVLISSVDTASFSNNYNIFLFDCNNAGSVLSPSSPAIDICACKIYKNDVLVRDFTPSKFPTPGLYDAISSEVFTNAGSGSLLYGSFDEEAYTPVEYITTGGSAHFITQAIGRYGLKVVAMFYPTGSTASWYCAIGGRDDTNRCEIFTGNTEYINARIYAAFGTTSKTLYSSSANNLLKNKKVTVVKNNNSFSTYLNYAALGSTTTFDVSTSFSTGVPLGIGANFYMSDSSWRQPFIGRIYYIRLDNYNFVPAKVNGVAGMYDTYNDAFYPSISETAFSAGSVI